MHLNMKYNFLNGKYLHNIFLIIVNNTYRFKQISDIPFSIVNPMNDTKIALLIH